MEREEFTKAFACYATTIDGLKFLSVVSPLSLIYIYIHICESCDIEVLF